MHHNPPTILLTGIGLFVLSPMFTFDLQFLFDIFRLADQSSTGGNIFYEFDEQDDWDEEDPDDDLDI